MQRIDENTYIDDTLVTYAEYQLFIDEMREQGKYYQPDHWTSYQFPERQAREPILGVRHSDAVAFCEWLTKRERSGWRYRLPTKEDASSFPVNAHGRSPLGYWIYGNDQFAWVGNKPQDAIAIGDALAVSLAMDLDRARSLSIQWSHPLNFISFMIGSDTIKELRANLRDRDPILRKELDSTFDPEDSILALNLYIPLFTLQERIAGRSPAFEGIRLVKERIR